MNLKTILHILMKYYLNKENEVKSFVPIDTLNIFNG